MSGVDNIFNTPEQKTIPKIVRIAASTVIEIIEVKMEVLSFSKFFAPNNCEIITAAPTFAPVAIAIKIIVIG